MCIRDRANKDLIGVVKTYDDIEENWKKGKMSALLTIEEGGVCQGDPVSYTHLDVYKRQGLFRTGRVSI